MTILEGVGRKLIRLVDIAFMIDESHQIKDPTDEMIESATNIEIALAKGALIDFKALWSLQEQCRVSEADELLTDAFLTDVRPLVAKARRGKR